MYQWSDQTYETMVLMAQNLNTKKIKFPEKEASDRNQDSSRVHICRHCGRVFKSDKALGGHLRIHRVHLHAKSEGGTRHCHRRMKSKKLSRKSSAPQEEEEDDDGGFACLVCDDSFSSMQLLCQHMRNHRDGQLGSHNNGFRSPIPSQESNLTDHHHHEPEPGSGSETQTETEESQETTTVEEGIGAVVSVPRINNQNLNLSKNLHNWTQTSKRGQKRSVSNEEINDNSSYNPMPLSVYFGPEVPLTERRVAELFNEQPQFLSIRKKQKTEETKPAAWSDDEFGADDSEISTSVEPISMMAQGSDNHISNKSKYSTSSKGRRSLNNPKAVKTEHQCEICGKTFQTGPALGGHKTYHRMNPAPAVVDPLVHRKAKQEYSLSGETGAARKYITRMLFPGALPEEVDEECYDHHQQHLDFDLNEPYVD